MISDDLQALGSKIASALSQRPECFITHPAELRVLQQLTATDLREFAEQRGWSVVRRLGGRQLSFYNDTFQRLANEADERGA